MPAAPPDCRAVTTSDAGLRVGTRERKLLMSSAVNIEVDEETRNMLSGLAMGDLEVLGEAFEMREAVRENSGLDARSFALVKIAALVALDSPPASYLWQISNAVAAGPTARAIMCGLRAVGPQVGGARTGGGGPGRLGS